MQRSLAPELEGGAGETTVGLGTVGFGAASGDRLRSSHEPCESGRRGWLWPASVRQLQPGQHVRPGLESGPRAAASRPAGGVATRPSLTADQALQRPGRGGDGAGLLSGSDPPSPQIGSTGMVSSPTSAFSLCPSSLLPASCVRRVPRPLLIRLSLALFSLPGNCLLQRRNKPGNMLASTQEKLSREKCTGTGPKGLRVPGAGHP